MGYAGYAPGHKVAEMATPLQQYLALVKSDPTLETMEKLVRNTAQAPAEEKFRKVGENARARVTYLSTLGGFQTVHGRCTSSHKAWRGRRSWVGAS